MKYTHTHTRAEAKRKHILLPNIFTHALMIWPLSVHLHENFVFFSFETFFVSFFGIEIVGERWSVQKRESGIKLKRSRAWTEKKKYIFLHLNILSFCYQMNPKQQSQTIDDQRYAEILNSVESFIFLILFRSRLDYRVTSFIFKKKKRWWQKY